MFMERVAHRFGEQLKGMGLSVAEAARQLRYSDANRLRSYLTNRTEPDLAEFAKLCHFFNVNPGEVLGLPVMLDADEYERVKVVDARASAGPGAMGDSEQVKHHVAFRREWLRTVTRAPVEKLTVIEADGSSMEPTIHDGDHLLVDTTQTNPRKDGLYVFEWDGFINVKRVTVNHATRTVSLRSDNPAHDSWDGVDPDSVRVLGRVIWVGRRV